MRIKKAWNSHTIILIISSLISVIFCAIIAFSSEILAKQPLDEAQANYTESCETVKNAYFKLIARNIYNLYSHLLGWAQQPVFENDNSTTSEIFEFLKKNKFRFNPDYHDIFWLDKSGFAYSIFGTVTPVTDRDYYTAIFKNNQPDFLSSGVFSKVTKNPIFIIAHAIYNDDGSLKGALCVSVLNTEISKELMPVSNDKIGIMAIVDQDGIFIAYPDEKYLNTICLPGNSRYVSSPDYAAVTDDTPFLTLTPDGKEAYATKKQIFNTNWNLVMFLPTYVKNRIERQRIRAVIVIMVTSVFFLTVLLIAEKYVLKMFEKRQWLEANYDSVTHIYTRRKFEIQAERLIRKKKNTEFMLIETDIKGFKFINKNYGEETGNTILCDFAEYISDIAAYYDGVCGRGFADHFYSLFIVESKDHALQLFEEVINSIQDRFRRSEIPVSSKYGVVFKSYTQKKKDENLVQHLIDCATLAKSTIKENSLVNYAIYDEALSEISMKNHYLENSQEAALENGEFFVMYQPKVNLKSEKISGSEALARWNNPKYGIIPPDEFIPLFEKNGFVEKLDFFVFEQVLKFLQKRINAGLKCVPISINMSRRHSNPQKFIETFMDIFNRYSVPANLIQVEILERAFSDNDVLVQITNMLHKNGFSVAMDDFGTGDSSLNMLSKVPIDVLKFDREFIKSATDENGTIRKKDALFIKSLIEISQKMNKETIFEGVETEKQRDFLREINCEHIQGFFYSRPLMEIDYVKFLENNL